MNNHGGKVIGFGIAALVLFFALGVFFIIQNGAKFTEHSVVDVSGKSVDITGTTTPAMATSAPIIPGTQSKPFHVVVALEKENGTTVFKSADILIPYIPKTAQDMIDLQQNLLAHFSHDAKQKSQKAFVSAEIISFWDYSDSSSK